MIRGRIWPLPYNLYSATWQPNVGPLCVACVAEPYSVQRALKIMNLNALDVNCHRDELGKVKEKSMLVGGSNLVSTRSNNPA